MNTTTRMLTLLDAMITSIETSLEENKDPKTLCTLATGLSRLATTAIRLESHLAESADDAPPPPPRTPPTTPTTPAAPATDNTADTADTAAATQPPAPQRTAPHTDSPVIRSMLLLKKNNPSYQPPKDCPRHILDRYHALLASNR